MQLFDATLWRDSLHKGDRSQCDIAGGMIRMKFNNMTVPEVNKLMGYLYMAVLMEWKELKLTRKPTHNLRIVINDHNCAEESD